MLGTEDVGKINEKGKTHKEKEKKYVLRITTLSPPPSTLAGNQAALQAPLYSKGLVGWFLTHD